MEGTEGQPTSDVNNLCPQTPGAHVRQGFSSQNGGGRKGPSEQGGEALPQAPPPSTPHFFLPGVVPFWGYLLWT